LGLVGVYCYLGLFYWLQICEGLKMNNLSKAIAGLGCIALAFWGYEHNLDGSVWLVGLGVLILWDLK
jgi:hypothetical protein